MATTPPLSHHDILALAEAFVHHGLRVDMAASQRQLRQLVFQPPHAAGSDGPRVSWLLQDRGGGRYRLTRTVHLPDDGGEATLSAQGSDLPALLARVQAVPLSRQTSAGPGFVIARHYTVDAGSAPVLSQGVVHLPDVTPRLVLTLQVPAVRRVAGNWSLTMQPQQGQVRPLLPEDLLAVLGWNWARLVPTQQGWTSRLRLRGGAEQRTQQAEAALDRAAAHLAQTLGEAPARYHARLRGARWAVFFRRGIPTFTALALVAGVLLSAAFKFQPTAVQMILLYHLPTLAVALSFVLQELPRFEIPPWPRALRAARWTA